MPAGTWMFDFLAQAANTAATAAASGGDVLPSWGETIGAAIRYFGVPGAIFAGFMYALQKGWIVMGREKVAAESRASEYKTERDAYKIERDQWMLKTIESYGDLATAVKLIEQQSRVTSTEAKR